MKARPYVYVFLAFAVVVLFTALPVFSQQPGFTIERMVVGTGVENKEPVGVKDSFEASTEKVFCFIEARNITEDAIITVVWSHEGKDVLKTELPLKKGPKWRTNANKNLHGLKGNWSVAVKDAQGSTVKSVSFKVN